MGRSTKLFLIQYAGFVNNQIVYEAESEKDARSFWEDDNEEDTHTDQLYIEWVREVSSAPSGIEVKWLEPCHEDSDF